MTGYTQYNNTRITHNTHIHNTTIHGIRWSRKSLLLMVIGTGQDLADHLNIQSNVAAFMRQRWTLFRRMFVVLVVKMIKMK